MLTRKIATTASPIKVMDSATIAVSYTAQGGNTDNEIDVKDFEYITLYVSYTIGDETGLKVKVQGLKAAGDSDEYQLGSFINASGVLTNEPQELRLTATVNAVPWLLDIRGVHKIKIYQARISGGTPTGTASISYVLSN